MKSVTKIKAPVATSDGHAERVARQLRIDLLFYGFCAAKEIAKLRGEPTGSMRCPLCQQELRFSTNQCNGHFHAKCATQDCINARE